MRILLTIAILFISTFSFSQSGKDTEKVFTVSHIQGADNLIITINGTQPNLDRFFMVNLIGRSVREVVYPKGEERVNVSNLSLLPPGMYILIAKDANGKTMATVKFYI
jgi:hypothetical protein